MFQHIFTYRHSSLTTRYPVAENERQTFPMNFPGSITFSSFLSFFFLLPLASFDIRAAGIVDFKTDYKLKLVENEMYCL